MAERLKAAVLLNRYRVKSSIEGSNPSLSATKRANCEGFGAFLGHSIVGSLRLVNR